MNTRILIATGIYPPEIGGPATYSKLLADKLPEHGITVDVLPFRDVRSLPKIIRHIAYFIKVLKRGKTADIIFAQDPVSVGFPTMLAAKIIQKRFFLKVVGDYAWEQGVQRFGVNDLLDAFSKQRHGYSLLVRVLKWVECRVAQYAEKIIVPSNYLKQIVINWGIDGQKIHVVYNAFSAPQTTERKEELRKTLKLYGNIMVSVGRLVPWKGFGLLVELMPELIKKNPELKLYIIGEGPEFYNLRKLIDTQSLNDRVFLLGKLPHDIVLKHLKAADLFVLNTGYEGFSHQLLEVMASGTPLITTAVGGNTELIAADENGVLVGYNDKIGIKEGIEKILSDKIFADKISANAQKKVKEFNEARMLQETVKQFI